MARRGHCFGRARNRRDRPRPARSRSRPGRSRARRIQRHEHDLPRRVSHALERDLRHLLGAGRLDGECELREPDQRLLPERRRRQRNGEQRVLDDAAVHGRDRFGRIQLDLRRVGRRHHGVPLRLLQLHLLGHERAAHHPDDEPLPLRLSDRGRDQQRDHGTGLAAEHRRAVFPVHAPERRQLLRFVLRLHHLLRLPQLLR